MTPHYGADYLVACQRIQQIGGVIQMPRGNKRRVPQSSPQKTTPSTCEDKRMQRCPGPLSNRPRGAPPGMNPDRMFLIAKGLGLVRRCADRWRQACAAPHPRRYLGRSQDNLARRRFTSIRRRQRQFSILPRVPGRAKSIATIICVAPKKLTKN